MEIMSYETFRKNADGHPRTCVTAVMSGDMETPITLYRKLAEKGGTFLLESVSDGSQRGRYSFIGSGVDKRITAYGYKWKVWNKEECLAEGDGKVIDCLRNIMGETIPSPLEEGPDFIGGVVGMMGYDLIRQYESLGESVKNDWNLPDADFFVVNQLAVYDHAKQTIVLIAVVENEGQLYDQYHMAIKKLKEMNHKIFQPLVDQEEKKDQDENASKKITSTESSFSFEKKVKQAKEYIRNGDIFQVVLSQRYCVDPAPSPFETYRKLRALNPSPYLFYFDFDDYQLVGASPEMLVKCVKGVVETCPIAGTKPRGRTLEEDQKLAEEMVSDEKERAEHLMLVDLARNDIGKVAKFGSVTVDPFMVVKKFSHVMHLVTEVQGKLRQGVDSFDAFIACFPAGTLSGAPKIRAMEIIDELEREKRGSYGGAVGYFSYNGNMDSCITIRSILFHQKKGYVQAGAGIVEDSVPEEEYQESCRKAQGLMQVLAQKDERKEHQ
ncbi:anthranilate synthase, component I [Tindallia magadiensis]|uniref:Anthranilate synthase component 1 n=1 Tax=Tindallia magadiensis TaxID=69895 RepID=A0A1I3B0F6_9FIRM|nr:anthranilate synthase component I [Tindallia magadiensis]SFH55576.1 anthranilate synthase, component I [Tindallia magadiensis]